MIAKEHRALQGDTAAFELALRLAFRLAFRLALRLATRGGAHGGGGMGILRLAACVRSARVFPKALFSDTSSLGVRRTPRWVEHGVFHTSRGKPSKGVAVRGAMCALCRRRALC